MSRPLASRRTVLITLAVLAVFAGGLAWQLLPGRQVSRVWVSPDGAHTLTLYRHPRLYAMPGQGSDAPGTLVLTDDTGRIVNRTRIDMVQNASDPVWQDGRVRMKLIFDWELP